LLFKPYDILPAIDVQGIAGEPIRGRIAQRGDGPRHIFRLRRRLGLRWRRSAFHQVPEACAPPRPDTSAQTILSLSFFACDKAADIHSGLPVNR
jgi:hypothetical protein